MGRHRRRRGHVRTGLIGASAALTVGAVAMGAGLLPSAGDGFPLSGTDNQAADRHISTRSATPAPSPTLERETERHEERESAKETTEPTDREAPAPPSPAEEPAPEPSAEAPEATEGSGDPEESAAPAPPAGTPAPATPSPTEEPAPVEAPETAAAEAVLTLVNTERATAGCLPLTLDADLTALAAAYSRDMAEREFFSHTDPDGLTPWDRAQAAGIADLGGENIARGQQDAQAVMDSWMESEGHRANILNCDYTTLGVGVHIAEGGPWWTQEFGF